VVHLFHCIIVAYAGSNRYSTIGILRRTSSLTNMRRPVVKKKSISVAIDPDEMPVYAMVNKSMRKKQADKHEENKSGSELYSKVDKSKKQKADVHPVVSDGPLIQCNTADDAPEAESSGVMTQSSVSPKVNSAALNAGYESIGLSEPSKDVAECDYDMAECGYDTVGDDFGYDSVDVVAEKGNKDRLSFSATLSRSTEHIYDVVREDPSDLKRMSTDYEDIREITNSTK